MAIAHYSTAFFFAVFIILRSIRMEIALERLDYANVNHLKSNWHRLAICNWKLFNGLCIVIDELRRSCRYTHARYYIIIVQ